MTKKRVIIEAAAAAIALTKAGAKYKVCILRDNQIIATIGKQIIGEHDTSRDVQNRTRFNLTMLMSKIKDKKGYDWDLS